MGNVKIAAIGPITASSLEKFFLKADFQPTEYVAECFFKEFSKKYVLKDKNVLLARSDKARYYLEEQLAKAGCHVESVKTYETLPETEYSHQALEKIENDEIDLAVFTSPSTVNNFFQIYKAKPNFRIASIGPITSAALKRRGYVPDIEAKEYTMAGIMNSILNFYKKNK